MDDLRPLPWHAVAIALSSKDPLPEASQRVLAAALVADAGNRGATAAAVAETVSLLVSAGTIENRRGAFEVLWKAYVAASDTATLEQLITMLELCSPASNGAAARFVGVTVDDLSWFVKAATPLLMHREPRLIARFVDALVSAGPAAEELLDRRPSGVIALAARVGLHMSNHAVSWYEAKDCVPGVAIHFLERVGCVSAAARVVIDECAALDLTGISRHEDQVNSVPEMGVLTAPSYALALCEPAHFGGILVLRRWLPPTVPGEYVRVLAKALEGCGTATVLAALRALDDDDTRVEVSPHFDTLRRVLLHAR
jgi:hypothetical protein